MIKCHYTSNTPHVPVCDGKIRWTGQKLGGTAAGAATVGTAHRLAAGGYCWGLHANVFELNSLQNRNNSRTWWHWCRMFPRTHNCLDKNMHKGRTLKIWFMLLWSRHSLAIWQKYEAINELDFSPLQAVVYHPPPPYECKYRMIYWNVW